MENLGSRIPRLAESRIPRNIFLLETFKRKENTVTVKVWKVPESLFIALRHLKAPPPNSQSKLNIKKIRRAV